MEKEIQLLYQPLYLFINKRVQNTSDAEDLVQEVFYKLSKAGNEEINNIKSWLFSVAQHTVIDFYRKKKPIQDELLEIAEDQKDDNEALRALESCMSTFISHLSEVDQNLLRLSEIEGKPQKEIAEMLNMNYTTVRSKIQRARKRLKNEFTDCCEIHQGNKGSIMGFKNRGNRC